MKLSLGLLAALVFAPAAQATSVDANRSGSVASAEVDREVAFTTSEGTWLSLDVAPDGQSIVFDLLGDLYRLPVGGGVAESLTSGSAWDTQPSISPDGRSILYISDRGGTREFWIMDIDGKAPRPLRPGVAPAANTSPEMLGGVWSADGRQVFATYHERKAAGLRLSAFSIDGALLRTYELADNMVGVAASSPDGTSLYVGSVDRFGPPSQWIISKLDLATGTSNQVSPANVSAFKPRVSPDGTSMVFLGRLDGKTHLLVRDFASGEVRRITDKVHPDRSWDGLTTLDVFPAYDFMPDGKSVVISEGGKIWSIDLASGQRREIPFSVEVRRTLAPLLHTKHTELKEDVLVRQLRNPAYSPDRRLIAFSALRHIWIFNSETQSLRRISSGSSAYDNPVWAPGGSALIYTEVDRAGTGHIVRAPLDAQCLEKEQCRQSRLARSDDPFFAIELIDGGERLLVSRRLKMRQGPSRTVRHVLPLADEGSPSELAPFEGMPVAAPKFVLGDIRGNTILSPDRRFALGTANGGSTGLVLIDLSSAVAMPERLDLGDGQFKWVPISKTKPDFVRWDLDGAGFTYSIGRSVFHSKRGSGTGALPDFARPQGVTVTLREKAHRARGSLILRNARLVTMSGQGVIERGDIFIVDGMIRHVGPAYRGKVPKDARVIDMAAHTILPGYIDLHAHIPRPDVSVPDLPWLAAYLAYGVTAIRDPQPEILSATDDFDYQDRVRTGDLLGPRYFSTGRSIRLGFNHLGLDSPTAVDSVLQAYGPEFNHTRSIKEYQTGSRIRRQWIAASAARYGLMPTSEGDLAEGLTFVVDGYSGMEHAYSVSSPAYRDVVELVARSGTVYTPTIAAGFGLATGSYFVRQLDIHAQRKLRRLLPHADLDALAADVDQDWHRGELYQFRSVASDALKIARAGGRVGVGSHGDEPGIGYHFELWALVEGGFTPLEAIHSATVTGAYALGLEDELGSLEVGKIADLQILSRNPLENIRDTLSVRYVVKGGRLHDADTLDELWPRALALDRAWRSRELVPLSED